MIGDTALPYCRPPIDGTAHYSLRHCLAAGEHIERYCGWRPLYLVPRPELALRCIEMRYDQSLWRSPLPLLAGPAAPRLRRQESSIGDDWRLRDSTTIIARTRYPEGTEGLVEDWPAGFGGHARLPSAELAGDGTTLTFAQPDDELQAATAILADGRTGYLVNVRADRMTCQVDWRSGSAPPAGPLAPVRLVPPADLELAAETIARRFRVLPEQTAVRLNEEIMALNRQLSRVLNRYRRRI